MQAALQSANSKCEIYRGLLVLIERRSLATPDARALLRAVIAAEPAVSPERAPVDDGASQATSSTGR